MKPTLRDMVHVIMLAYRCIWGKDPAVEDGIHV